MKHDNWLKTKDAARIIGMTQGALANRAKAGTGPKFKHEMRFLVFLESSVMEFAEKWQAIHKRDKPVKRSRSKTKKVMLPRFCKECGKEIANRKFFYCSDRCRIESKNKRQRQYNETLKDGAIVRLSSIATCPKCGCQHKVFGWTGKTDPKMFCPDCKEYINKIDYTYETRAVGCQI